MFMYKNYLLCIFVFMLIFASASFGDAYWDDGGADHLWMTPANWENDVVPATNEKALIGAINGEEDDSNDLPDPNMDPNAPDPNGAVINTPVHVEQFQIGEGGDPNEPASLIVNADMDARDGNSYVGRGNNRWGVMVLNSGEVLLKDFHVCRYPYSRGHVIVNGGTLTNQDRDREFKFHLKSNDADDALHAHIQINGGTVAVGGDPEKSMDGFNFKYDNKGTIDLAGGTLTVDYDRTSLFTQWFNNGHFSSYGYSDDLRRFNVSYDEDNNWTVITGIHPNDVDLGAAYLAEPVGSGVYVDTNSLTWTSGDDAATETLYFGTDETLVANADPSVEIGSVSSPVDITTILTGGLAPDSDYYWRIDTTDSNSNNHPGDVLHFGTKVAIVADDFERYADETEMLNTWSNAAALVSTPAKEDYAMQIDYDSTSSPYEVTKTYATGQDWTVFDRTELDITFWGDRDNDAQPIYMTLADDVNSATFTGQQVIAAIKEIFPNGELTVREEWNHNHIDLTQYADAGVDMTNVKELTIQIGDNSTTGGTGTLYVDDLKIFSPRCLDELTVGDPNNDCIANLFDFQIVASDWMLEGGQVSATAAGDPDSEWFKLDEASGYDAADSSGAGFDAVLKNFSAPGWVSGKFNSALEFDGTDDYLVLTGLYGDGPPYEIGDPTPSTGATWACWVKTTAWATQPLMCIADPTTAACEHGSKTLFMTSEGTVDLRATGSGGVSGQIRINDGQWHHVAATVDFDTGDAESQHGTDADTIKIYIDGVLDANDNDRDIEKHNDSSAGAYSLLIGPRMPLSGTISKRGGPFKGLIDEVRVYDTILSQAEIVDLADKTSVSQPVDSNADISGDGKVDFNDLDSVVENWVEDQFFPIQ